MINQIHTRCAANKSKMHYVLRTFVFTSVFTSMSYCLLVSPGVFASTVAADSERTAQKILHLLDYVSVDYVNVVKNGVVTNEDEYREQMEFTGRLTALVDQLPASSEKPSLRNEAAQLRKAVEIDERLWAIHREMVDLAQANKVQFVKALAEVAGTMLKLLK